MGSLYDARTERVLAGTNLLNVTELPANLLKTNDTQTVTCTSLETLTGFREKCDKLNVAASMRLSAMAGMVELKYFLASMIYECQTKHETFSLTTPDVKKLISPEALKNAETATHVVVGIQWGANLIAHFTKSTDVDVVAADGIRPQTFTEIIECMDKMPEHVKSANNGKGVPLVFDLFPLNEIDTPSRFELNEIDRSLHHIDETIVFNLLVNFDRFIEQKQKLSDFAAACDLFRKHFYEQDLISLKNKQTQVDLFEIGLRDRLKTTLVSIRSGKEAASTLDQIMDDYQHETLKLKEFLEEKRCMANKCTEIKHYESNLGVEFFFGTPFDHTFSGYILFYTEQWRQKLSEQWNNTIKLLRLLQLIETDKKFYLCDLDLSVNLQINAMCLQYFQNGNCLDDDLYESKKELLTCQLARSESFRSGPIKPAELCALKLRCPNAGFSGCANKVYREWKCASCLQAIEFDLDLNFYCDCGTASHDTFVYKCSDPHHPNQFLATQDSLEAAKIVENCHCNSLYLNLFIKYFICLRHFKQPNQTESHRMS